MKTIAKQTKTDITKSNIIRLSMDQALDMPWAALNELRRIVLSPWYKLLFAINGVQWKKGWHIYGMPIIQRFRGSEIEIGDHAWLRSWRSSNPLIPLHPVTLSTRSKKAVIHIGNYTNLTSTILVAMDRIEIGNHVWIGSNTTIVDTDFHPLDPNKRLIAPSEGSFKPVVIEDDVFIGMNCLILKGVHIGSCSVVGAGSVVTRNVPPNAVVAGNPAVIVKQEDISNTGDISG